MYFWYLGLYGIVTVPDFYLPHKLFDISPSKVPVDGHSAGNLTNF